MWMVWMAAAVAGSQAGSQGAGPLSPDRPGYADGTDALAKGGLQLEAGLSLEQASGATAWDAPGLLVRYGVTDGLEGRVFVPSWGAAGGEGALGPLGLGAKVPLAAGPVALSLTPTVEVPLQGGGVAGALGVNFGLDLTDALGLSGNVLGAYEGEGIAPSASVGVGGGGDAWGWFAEGIALDLRGGPFAAGAGVVWLPSPDVQLDLSATGVPAQGGAPSSLQAGVGVAWRVRASGRE